MDDEIRQKLNELVERVNLTIKNDYSRIKQEE